jgi:hypothetical protein
MKKIISTLMVTFFIANTFAQKTCSILNANAFYSVVMRGNMPVDENGMPRKVKPNLARTIFISSNCSSIPVVSKVMYDNISIPFFIEKTTKEEVSNLMDDMNNKIKLNAPTSSFIWKITIVPSGGVSVPENPKIISIQWKQKTNIKKLVLKKETQLATLPTY